MKNPATQSETYTSFTVPTGILTLPVGFLPPATSDFPMPTDTPQAHKQGKGDSHGDIIATIRLPDPDKKMVRQRMRPVPPGSLGTERRPPLQAPNVVEEFVSPTMQKFMQPMQHGEASRVKNKSKHHKQESKKKSTDAAPVTATATPAPITPISLSSRVRRSLSKSRLQRRDTSMSFHGQPLTIDPEFETTNSTLDRTGRIVSMTITGLYPAPQGSSDVILIYSECIRSLVWVEQSFCNTLKENAAGIALWGWLLVMGIAAVSRNFLSLFVHDAKSYVFASGMVGLHFHDVS